MMKVELARAFDLGSNFTARLINVSENETFKIESVDGRKFALRLNRPGYHTAAEFASEMAWLESLHAQKIITAARPLRGYDGNYLQKLGVREGVLFQWLEGSEPLISDNLFSLAHELGAIAAKLHDHVEHWQRPAGFTRLRWDFAAALGEDAPRWGHWRKGLGVAPNMLPLFQQTVDLIKTRLERFGESSQRFGLIHGDLRLSNLLVDGAQVKVIDFDDSGFGWFMYDAATMVSFHEHEVHVPDLIAQWVKGYRTVRALPAEDENEIGTFMMFRRLLLLAWLGTHAEIDLARTLKPTFADQTTILCERYLQKFG
jgi:Ser/Thr protein kinase RdoA (MazF antagonist)